MLKNVAGQNITAVLLDTAGAVVTTGTTTVYVLGDAGTQASMGTATHEGNGAWSIDVTQAESNYDDIGFTWVNTGAVTVHQHVFTDATYDRIGSTGSGLTSLATASALTTVDNEIAAIDTVVDAILVDTGTTLPASIATIDGNVDAILVDTGTTLPATLSTIDTVVDGIQTDLSNGTDGLGAIKADTAAILTDTGTTLPASIATVDSNVDAILVDTGTTLPASIATIDSNVDAILVDTGTTLDAAIAAIAADQKPKVNTALNNIPIYMVQSTDNKTPATGLTPTVTISQDGGAFAAINAISSIAEVGSGWYRLNLVSSDMNAAVIFINVSATGANSVPLTIATVD